MVAVAGEVPVLKRPARAELLHALDIDYTSADLLIDLVSLDLDLGNFDEAQRYYDQFKLVAKGSKLNQFVKDLHERQQPPSLPNP